MAHILVRHKVADFDKWKAVFDEHSSVRQASGSKGGVVFRSSDDPNEVVILMEWENLEKARQFSQSEDLKEAMQKAGVADQPDIYFLDEADKPSV
ncbi:antibiotic biosynthesis monooxygenase [candidate division TA06 bacterium]|nr:antibiotic biosynthesis monooxygenase [candidate division TA06 bacterium]